jgi:ABC-2 type transport system ATP-binding protein
LHSIVIENVTKVFRHRPVLFNWISKERCGETRALDNVTLTAASGETLVLLGPNGSGKTTLLKLISGMLLPDSGRISIKGVDALDNDRKIRQEVAFAVASERSFFARLTASENLDFFGTLENIPRSLRRQRAQEVLRMVELSEFEDTLVMKFSAGMYQRLGIARALLKQPSILLLDEPTRSLDPGAAGRLRRLLRRMSSRGCTLVLATHSFEDAIEVGDALVMLRRGLIAAQGCLSQQTSVDELRSFYFREMHEEEEIKFEAAEKSS